MNERHEYTQIEFNKLLKTVATVQTASDSFAQKLSNASFRSMNIRYIELHSKKFIILNLRVVQLFIVIFMM